TAGATAGAASAGAGGAGAAGSILTAGAGAVATKAVAGLAAAAIVTAVAAEHVGHPARRHHTHTNATAYVPAHSSEPIVVHNTVQPISSPARTDSLGAPTRPHGPRRTPDRAPRGPPPPGGQDRQDRSGHDGAGAEPGRRHTGGRPGRQTAGTPKTRANVGDRGHDGGDHPGARPHRRTASAAGDRRPGRLADTRDGPNRRHSLPTGRNGASGGTHAAPHPNRALRTGPPDAPDRDDTRSDHDRDRFERSGAGSPELTAIRASRPDAGPPVAPCLAPGRRHARSATCQVAPRQVAGTRWINRT